MGLRGRRADRRTSRSTWSSSARAPTAASPTCAARRRVVRGRRVAAGGAGAGRARLEAGEAPRPRPRGSTGSSARPASSGATPAARCASAMNDDVAAPGERCACDQQPQLRGPPGPGRPHPPRQPADGRRRGDRRAPGRTCALRRPTCRRWTDGARSRVVDGRRGARSTGPNVDTDQIIPDAASSSASSAPGSASSCSGTGGARTRSSRSTGPSYAGAPILVAGAQLRLRLVARARGLGARRTTASGPSWRRASPTSSAPTARKIGLLPVTLPEDEVADLIHLATARPGVTVDGRPRAPARRHVGRAMRSRSRSTRSSASACSTAGTTSPSPSATRTRSPATSASASGRAGDDPLRVSTLT